MTKHIQPSSQAPSSQAQWRIAGALGLVAIAIIHGSDVSGKLAETPYIGWMYIGLVIASLTTAAILLFSKQHRLAWMASAGLAASTFIGYCLSRTTGLPHATGDIGNWGEPLGVVSLIVEAFVVTMATFLLRPDQKVSMRSLRTAQE